jgi:hypothetical protein
MKSNGGALHLILFDTSPLQVHTHANFCMRTYTAATKELPSTCMQAHAIVCTRLHETCITTAVNKGETKPSSVPKKKETIAYRITEKARSEI